MNVLDLFSGIGGFSLGLERAGMRTVAFCEQDERCRRVLAKHWPGVPCYDDVRTLTADRLRSDGISVDVICGGFPCQDISFAGKGAGIEGARSGLWSEYARIIGELRPLYVIVENVSALLSRGLDVVLGDLATLGYDAEWHCIPAAAVGAPHRRDRIWIVANPQGERWGEARQHSERHPQRIAISGALLADANESLHARGLVGGADKSSAGRSEGGDLGEGKASHGERVRFEPDAGGTHVADTDQPRLEGWIRQSLRERACEWASWAGSSSVSDADSEPQEWATEPRRERGQWFVEPDVGRVADGVPARMDRLKELGNAVVPQIPEIIGRAIMATAND